MKQEEKELLLKDLSARLPYGVIVTDNRHGDSRITEIDTVEETVYCDDFDEYVKLDKCKPYLRPMSSVTEEEKNELGRISCEGNIEHKYGIFYRSQDYLNSIHVAYRTIDGKDMFELGLALEAPEGMYE